MVFAKLFWKKAGPASNVGCETPLSHRCKPDSCVRLPAQAPQGVPPGPLAGFLLGTMLQTNPGNARSRPVVAPCFWSGGLTLAVAFIKRQDAKGLAHGLAQRDLHERTPVKTPLQRDSLLPDDIAPHSPQRARREADAGRVFTGRKNVLISIVGNILRAQDAQALYCIPSR